MTNVAQTILQQLGGDKAVAMLGVKFAVALQHDQGRGTEYGLRIRFSAKGLDKINHLEIVLDDSTDTYNVSFWCVRGISCVQVDHVDHVYAEDLRRVIERRTGLALSL